MSAAPIEMPADLRQQIDKQLARGQYERAIELFNSRPGRRLDDPGRVQGWRYVEPQS